MGFANSSTYPGGEIMEIVTLGIDLAKNIFALHDVDTAGKVVLQRPAVKRAKLLELTAGLAPCLIGMEACSGAHHWAREMTRQGYVEQRTALINRIRGLLSELGIVLPQKAETIRRELVHLLEDLPGHCNTVAADAITDLERLDARIAEYDRHIAKCAKDNADARRLMQLSGIGPTAASALVAAIGDGHDFASGRQFAAWLGMVPGQYSSGGKQRLGRITKAGDRYLRTLLILGARSVLQSARKKEDAISRWTRDVESRRGYWKAVVAMAAKNARLAWAVLRRGEEFQSYGQSAPAAV